MHRLKCTLTLTLSSLPMNTVLIWRALKTILSSLKKLRSRYGTGVFSLYTLTNALPLMLTYKLPLSNEIKNEMDNHYSNNTTIFNAYYHSFTTQLRFISSNIIMKDLHCIVELPHHSFKSNYLPLENLWQYTSCSNISLYYNYGKIWYLISNCEDQTTISSTYYSEVQV